MGNIKTSLYDGRCFMKQVMVSSKQGFKMLIVGCLVL